MLNTRAVTSGRSAADCPGSKAVVISGQMARACEVHLEGLVDMVNELSHGGNKERTLVKTYEIA